MMDLWHCHKPNDDEEQCNPSKYADHPGPEDKTASPKSILIDRAYGANSRFFAQPGIGLIYIMNFFLMEADCKNIRIEKNPRYLLLWIFGTSLRFSCSNSTRKNSVSYDRSAIKVFWKVILSDRGSKVLDGTGIEEIVPPLDTVTEIEKALEENFLFLPLSSRKYQEWKVRLSAI
ncbi:hypothetical protein GcM1_201049 [Golovinomyces cichoracearum]|uniref:Uncharacterized protein n=1 Tax=Golovinomyces cichoracearum TaxID=62708 RepID=A0A420IYF9_9PEZI|nr:hypothetical protein GcM1_201049 [Golovinomyces cichoracearum]